MANIMKQKDLKPGKSVHALSNVSVLGIVFCVIWKDTYVHGNSQ